MQKHVFIRGSLRNGVVAINTMKPVVVINIDLFTHSQLNLLAIKANLAKAKDAKLWVIQLS